MDAVSLIADVQKVQIERRKLLKAWGPCGTAQSPADFIAQFNEAAERIATEYGPNFFTPRLVLEGDGLRLRHRGGKCSIGHCMNVLDQLEAITSDPDYALMSDFIFAAMAQAHQKKLTNPDGLYFIYLVYERA